MIMDESPAHWCWIGGPGSGKNICSAPSLAGYLGSVIHASNKPDACDLWFGARIDQNRLKRIDRDELDEEKYADPRGTTRTRFWVPNGRGIVLDWANQSVYPGGKHTLVSDINLKDAGARILASAIADGFFPEIPGSKKDNWFVKAPASMLSAAILHFLSWHQDPRMHNLPYIVERCMGFDRLTGKAGTEVVTALLKEMPP